MDSSTTPFTIVYNHFLSTEYDVGVQTIGYKVTFLEYLDIQAPINGQFSFEIEEACSSTYLKEHEIIKEIYTIRAMETRVPSFPYLAYTDEISDVMGKAGTCGDITYTLYNEDEEILGEEAIVRVKSYAGASTFYIELDTSQSS